jgi:sec-independent protein translocase protein TatA
MNSMFALFDMGGGQIVLILALILIFFGARRIPELAKGLGQGIKEFKKATREMTDEIQNAANDNSYSAPHNDSQPKQVTEGSPKPAAVPQSADASHADAPKVSVT